MHLSPHHFQAQARYFEDSIQFAASLLSFAPYGVWGCVLDEEALRNGTISLAHARGLFPDGLHFDMPDCDGLPTPRNIADVFSPIQQQMTVFLAIKAYKRDGMNSVSIKTGDTALARFIAEQRSLHDENTGSDEKTIQLARKNIRILLENEVTNDDVSLAIARITRDGAGHFIYDPNFIAPCINLAASRRLMTITTRLIEILEEKSRAVSRTTPAKLGTRAAFSPGEVASFWFLHCVNSGLGTLRHLHDSSRAHPEQLYIVMSQIAGALCTFAIDSDPRSVPPYEHNRLTEVFDALDKHIRRHLNFVVPPNCITLPLVGTSTPFYFHTGTITDARCFGRSQWIMGIRAAIPQLDLMSKTPVLVKVCSNEFIVRLVQTAKSGLTLSHLEVPPADISPNVDTEYFSIERLGPCWDHIKRTQDVGIYVPEQIPQPEIEIFIILDSKAD